MDHQTAINLAFGVAGGLGGWILRVLHAELKALQLADRELTDKVHGIETLVAGEYVTRDALDRTMGQIFDMLGKIDQKLDRKIDKP